MGSLGAELFWKERAASDSSLKKTKKSLSPMYSKATCTFRGTRQRATMPPASRRVSERFVKYPKARELKNSRAAQSKRKIFFPLARSG